MGVGRSFPSNSCGLPIEAIEEGVHWLAQKVGELGLRAVASVDRVGFHAPLSVPLVSTSIYIYSTIYIYIYMMHLYECSTHTAAKFAYILLGSHLHLSISQSQESQTMVDPGNYL